MPAPPGTARTAAPGGTTTGRQALTGPHIDQLDRDQLDDHGLIDDDRTEDLRPNSRTAPEPRVHHHPAGTAHTHLNNHEESE